MVKASRLVGLGLTSCLALGACVNPGDESRPDVYDQSQVNAIQRGRVVTIISVSSARVRVNNAQNHQTAQVVGGILGAALGAGLASGAGGAGWGGGLAAGAGGTAAGALAGGAISQGQAIVKGVTIAYQDRAGGEALLSTQVGRPCEYHPGTALLVTTSSNETRVQPNASCPTK